MKFWAGWITSWNQDCLEPCWQRQICKWYHSDAEREEELKRFIDSEREEWKSWLKTQHSKTKIMASGPTVFWQIAGEKVDAVIDFICLGSKITVNGDCHHEIKRRLFLGRKAMTNLASILKSNDITLLTKVCTVKAMFFPVVMYRWEFGP